MHRLDVNGSVMGAAGAFAMGVARAKMRRQAYVEAVIEGRERDAQRRQVARLVEALNVQTARADAAAAQAVASRILRNLRAQ